ncbi:MAG TPA: transposase [Terriglobia bacterium]|nr:transposase [Terriglobia bacterium]
MAEFRRKNIRLPAARYVGRWWYFLTMVVEGRAERFSDASLVAENLHFLTEHARSERFAISACCFMPDHLHLLTNGTEIDANLLRFCSGFKQESAFIFKQRTGSRLWQKKYYDHILRADERWEPMACYIWNNPVRKGLCERAEDWPCSGSLTLNWRRLLSVGLDPWVPPWKAGTSQQRPSGRRHAGTGTMPG